MVWRMKMKEGMVEGLIVVTLIIASVLLFKFDSWKTGWIPAVTSLAVMYIIANKDRINQG